MHTKWLTIFLTGLLAGLFTLMPISMVFAEHKVDPELKDLAIKMTPKAYGPGFEFISLKNILFKHGNAKLDRQALNNLDEIAQYLLVNDNTIHRIIIEGHTSDIADADYNFRLSDQRAYAVRDYLAGRGVTIERIIIKGRGETTPVDQNWTRDGRSRNRRVSVHVVKMPS